MKRLAPEREKEIREAIGAPVLSNRKIITELLEEIDALREEIVRMEQEVSRIVHQAENDYDKLEGATKGLHSQIAALREALTVTRGQWVHSAHRKQCLDALEEKE